MLLYDVLFAVFAVLCLGLIVDPRVHTGVAGSLGLGLISAAAFAQLDVWTNPLVSLRMALAGAALGLLQVWVNRRREAALLRRLRLPPPPVGLVREPSSCERTSDRAAA